MNKELGLSFRSENKKMPVLRETAQRYGMQLDFLGMYDDLGDTSPMIPLYEAACNLPKLSKTRLGIVGFAVPKFPSMVDVAGYLATLNEVINDPSRIVAGFVPGAWMDKIGLHNATVDQSREAIESLRYLLAQKTDGYNGNYYNIGSDFVLNYATPSNVPILIGAWGPRFAALAGEVADEIKVGGSSNPLMVPIIRERVKVGAEKCGRSENDIRIALGAVTVVDEDGERAMQEARRKAVVYINIVGDKDPSAMYDFPDEIQAIKKAMEHNDVSTATQFLPDDLLKRFVVAGTPQQVTYQVETLFDAGADRFEFGTPHGVGESMEDELRGVELLVNKVIPYFK